MARTPQNVAAVWSCLGLLLCAAAPGAGAAGDDWENRGLLVEAQALREQLTEREDVNKVENPFVVELWGRPLSMNGQYEALLFDTDKNPFGDGVQPDRRLLLEQELELEAFYPVSPRLAFFAQLRFLLVDDLDESARYDLSERYLERGEMWVIVRDVLDLPLSLEAGRLNFEDDRRWWWDDDLDAVRATVEMDDVEVAVAAAYEVATVRSDQGYVESDHANIARLLLESSWDWHEDHAIQFFALYQDDQSNTPQPGDTFPVDDEDESDARLTWLGARASGVANLDPQGLLGYWLDMAYVQGNERLAETGEVEETPGTVAVEEVVARRVRGWGIDAGLTYLLPLAARPRVTVGYAMGSGDAQPEDGTDRAFRQTGVHANEPGFGGVERFRGYGELLDPDLSNIAILTAGLGVSLLESSSLDLVFHDYRLVEPAEAVSGDGLDTRLTGASRDLGWGLDLVLGLEEWEVVELTFVASALRGGDAFGSEAGAWNYGGWISFRVAF